MQTERKNQNHIESAEIVAIGSEMLLGELVDTNSAWISQRLAALGVGIYRHTTVGDNKGRIVTAIKEAAARSNLVLTTGGLGPTSDDLTNECLALVAGRKMVEYPEARKHVDEMFRRFGRKPTPSNYKQVLFPEGSELIPNPRGTAMGALLEIDDALVATFPGVPMEMKGMFEETVEPLIKSRSQGSIVSRTLWFTGIGESALAERVQDFLDASDPTVAPLAGQGKVRLRVTTRAATPEDAEKKIEPVAEEILSRLGEFYFGEDDETLESSVGQLLKDRGATPGPRRELHRRPAGETSHRRARLFGVLHRGARHLLQRSEGTFARRHPRDADGIRGCERGRCERDGRGCSQGFRVRLRALCYGCGGTWRWYGREAGLGSCGWGSRMLMGLSRSIWISRLGPHPGRLFGSGALIGHSTSYGSGWAAKRMWDKKIKDRSCRI